MIQDGQLVKFVNGGDAARIQKVQIAVGRDATRAPRVQHSVRGMPVQVVTGEDPTRAPFIHPFEGLAPAAWFRPGVGITVTGSGVSQWDDQSGNGRHLLQGTDAARPIDLPFSGTRYLYLPGVVGNYASTPDSVANSITGDIDIRVRVAMDDWTPGSVMEFVAKRRDAANKSYRFSISALGVLSLFWSADGATELSEAATTVTGITDGATKWVRVALDCDNGSTQREVKFYTAADSSTEPSSWTQLGGTVTTAGTTSIFNGDAVVEVGGVLLGTANATKGKIYRAIIKNGIDGTTVVDFNPADADGDGDTSFASSTTGETWTINSSGGLPAQIVGRAAILCNGTSHYLKANAFTLNQPEWVLWVGKQVSWTANDVIFDGDGVAGGALQQTTSTPRLSISAGSSVAEISTVTLNTRAVLSAVFNGASSSLSRNLDAAATGNAGAGNMGGLTLGAIGGGAAAWSNISTSELIVFPFAPSAALQARLIAGLMARHGVA